MSIDTDLIDRVRDRNIVEEAQHHVTLKRVSRSSPEWLGPCPQCGGRDRFSINTKKQVFNCRGCGAKGRGAIDFVMFAEGCDFRTALERLGGQTWTPSVPKQPARNDLSPDEEQARNLKSAARIVSQLVPVIGTPGEAFLRDERRIDTDALPDVLEEPYAIGWHPATYFKQPDPAEPHHELHGQKLGCIVAILTDPVTALPTGAVSRTFIGPDLKKIGKAKSLAGSGIVRLSRDEDVLLGLHICEGLETGLDAMSKGFRPLWATGSTSLLAAFPLLGGIDCLTFLADRDRNEAGERAAKTAAARWQAAGREVRILRRKAGFGDLNDCRD